MSTATNPMTRRNFLRILAMAGTAGLAAKLGWDVWGAPSVVRETRIVMGTLLNLTLVGDDGEKARAAITASLDRMQQLEAELSRFRSDSQLSRLNKDGYLRQADSHLVDLLQQSYAISQLSQGAFDVTVKPLTDAYEGCEDGLPTSRQIDQAISRVDYRQLHGDQSSVWFSKPGMGITLDGIGKGYILDQGVEILRQEGFNDVVVEAGGDLFASGHSEAQTGWRIGIQAPRASVGYVADRLWVADQAVATSGDYIQAFTDDLAYHHILDPRSGYSAPSLASATVIAPTTVEADALATTLMVLEPEQALSLITKKANTECLLITKDNQRLTTPGYALLWG